MQVQLCVLLNEGETYANSGLYQQVFKTFTTLSQLETFTSKNEKG